VRSTFSLKAIFPFVFVKLHIHSSKIIRLEYFSRTITKTHEDREPRQCQKENLAEENPWLTPPDDEDAARPLPVYLPILAVDHRQQEAIDQE
jgi:hypothetical protein